MVNRADFEVHMKDLGYAVDQPSYLTEDAGPTDWVRRCPEDVCKPVMLSTQGYQFDPQVVNLWLDQARAFLCPHAQKS